MKNQPLTRTIFNIFMIAGILAVLASGSLGIQRAIAVDTQPQDPGEPPQPLPFAPSISVDPTEIVSIQSQEFVTKPLTITNSGDANLDWVLYDTFAEIAWEDNFDSYATGSSMHGQGGWKGWANDPNATAFTSDLFALSAPNSVEIVNISDLVHEYSGYTSGTWTYTAWQYIPTDFAGESYFILLNQYDDAGVTNNWSVQVDFNSATNLVVNTGFTGGTLPLIKGEWVELRVEINLDTDVTSFYYDDQLLYTGSWTDEVSGGGIANIAAVDLWGNSASEVYYDDFSLSHLEDVAWLSTTPSAGTTPAAGSSNVDVELDATALTFGVYTATLFASSNDPVNPLLSIPVTMTVLPESDLGISISDTPDPVSAGELITYTLSVNNAGPDEAMGVTVVDTLPGGTTFDHASAGCVEAGGIVTCAVGTLASGASAEITIVVMAPSTGGDITNSATVGGDVIDANTGNNTDSEVTTVTSAFYITFLSIVMK